MNKFSVFLLLAAIMLVATLTAFTRADMSVATRRLATTERLSSHSNLRGRREQRQQERRVREDDVTRDVERRQRSVDSRRMDENARRISMRDSRQGAEDNRMERRSVERDTRLVVANERRDLATLNHRRSGEERDNRRVREETAARRLNKVREEARQNVGLDNRRRIANERFEVVAERQSRQMDSAASERRRNSPLSVTIGDASRRRDVREKDLTRTDDRMGNLGYARAMKITDEQGNGGWTNVAISGSLAMFAIMYYMQKANAKQRRDSLKCD